MRKSCTVCVNRNEPCAQEDRKGKCPEYEKARFCLTCSLLDNGCPQGYTSSSKGFCNCGDYKESK